jgi:hypothetical protein
LAPMADIFSAESRLIHADESTDIDQALEVL